jgi:DNA-binding transcriptional LysR family regulator
MVEAGPGIGTLPRMTVEVLRYDSLRMIEITKPRIAREIGVVTRHGFALSPAAQEFMKVVHFCLEQERRPPNSKNLS